MFVGRVCKQSTMSFRTFHERVEIIKKNNCNNGSLYRTGRRKSTRRPPTAAAPRKFPGVFPLHRFGPRWFLLLVILILGGGRSLTPGPEARKEATAVALRFLRHGDGIRSLTSGASGLKGDRTGSTAGSANETLQRRADLFFGASRHWSGHSIIN